MTHRHSLLLLNLVLEHPGWLPGDVHDGVEGIAQDERDEDDG